ncbi:trace amine-associated receptor 13c-like [Erpetoichthys calabaricus]|uniref:trace amine-associated receptor 13c-like n=1 Tax=Erpetoichthys calabaricus TaxID=27687 RepID=UPI002234A05D|nr:trace amine-associated receptor 13c-like [Erpetoichthys calabaricus]
MQKNLSVEYCYHSENVSCVKEPRTPLTVVTLYFCASVAGMLTFYGNLVVIISISHFKQLHTPTNVLVLSLAVADCMIGIIVMPIMVFQFIETCWYFGNTSCVIYSIALCCFTVTSIINMVLIAIDRNIAVCKPFIYSSKVTVRVASLAVGIVWLFAFTYSCSMFLFDGNLEGVIGLDPCPGDCVIMLTPSWNTTDLIISFILPFSIIISLYGQIFVVAQRQASAISAQQKIRHQQSKILNSIKSERKAAKTLGIVISVFLSCWLPFYTYTVINQFFEFSLPLYLYTVLIWLTFMNSGMNPIIYAFFYPWFRKSFRLLITLRICSTGSSLVNVFNEN